jgi:hypothetical protein
MILQGLKPIIFDRIKPYAGKWVKELPSVLWALRTSESCYRPHTIFYSLQIRGNVTHRIGAQIIPYVALNEEQSEDSGVDDLTRLEELHEAMVI